MTARSDLAVVVQRNEAAAFHGFMVSDLATRKRFGFTVARRQGLVCLGSDRLRIPLFHRAIGLGVTARADSTAVAAVLRHYAELGTEARIEVADGIAPIEVAGLLDRHGFQREREVHVVHALEADRPPEVRPVRGLRIEQVLQAELGTFGRLARVGFEESGDRGVFVERSSAFVLSHRTPGRFIGYIGYLDGQPVSTGLVCLTAEAGGLYSDSTIPEFRGRGIQKAMIAARIEAGLLQGRRMYTARTEGANTSARNYEQTGFTPLYRASFWTRPTD